MKQLVCIAASVMIGWLSGCSEGMYDPKYPRSRVAFDDGLVGRWTPVKHDSDPPTIIVVERREVPVANGVLRPDHEPGKPEEARPEQGGTRAAETTPAYRISIPTGKEGEEPFKMHGYLVEAGGGRFLGIQVTLSQLSRGAGYPFSIPTHILCKVEREGDLVRIWAPRVWIAWAPELVMLDAPEGAPPPIDLDKVGDRVGLTGSIDRLIDFCAAHADDPRLYGEVSEWKRAPDAPALPPPDSPK